ncbi:MAG: N-acetylneuraminate synthase family protein [Thermodesulfobacteriota bacterium]
MVNSMLWKQAVTRQTPFLIAEIGVNHENDIKIAKKMIDEAKKAGADAVKFQTYKAEKLAVKNSPAYWDRTKEKTDSQYQLFKKYDKFGEKEFILLADYCKKKGIIFLSTPFDFAAVDFLDRLVPFFKISSSDITNIPFIRYIARKRKPIILSTGAATIAEIDEAVSTIREKGNKVALLHCILDYPTQFENANLNMIKHMKNIYPDLPVGYSDHTVPDDNMLVLTMAFLSGAQIIEKHFTLDKSLPGNDHYHAMDPDDIKIFKNNLDLILTIGGEYYKKPLVCERVSRKNARRSLVANTAIRKGEIITTEMLTMKRPGTGISPRFFDQVVGRRADRYIAEDEIITWRMLI